MSEHEESAAEAAGIVDQQGAALEAMDDAGTDGPPPHPASTAEAAGIVDQQDAVLEAMDPDEEE